MQNVMMRFKKIVDLLVCMLKLDFLPKRLRFTIRIISAIFLMTYLSIYCVIGIHAHQLLNHPITKKADIALILGNRAYLDGAPNPCLTGRVDEGLRLAKQGLVSTLLMSGGIDHEDNRIEARVMQEYAAQQGFKGKVLLEQKSSSTLENFKFSARILDAEHAQSVVIISEPYHLWRAEKLAAAGHLGKDLEISYAAAPSQCWTRWGMLFKGSLREPLAVMNNFAKGYF